MGKRGRPRRRREEEQEEDGESTYIPPTSVRRKLDQQSPPDPSSPSPPREYRLYSLTKQLSSLILRPKYTTRQSLTGLRSRTPKAKEVPSGSSCSSHERSLSAEKVAQLTPTTAKLPTSVLPQSQDPLSQRTRYSTRTFLAKCGTMRTPLRSPVRNVNSVPCLSSASSPQRNVLAENVENQQSPPMAEIPSSECPQAQEAISSLHTCPNSQATASPPPHQDADGHNQKENPSSPASSFNCTEIAAMVANDSFDPDEVASKAYPALVTVDGYRVKEEMAPLLRSIISKYGDIGKECTFQSLEVRSSLMEKVCGIYRSLEQTESILFTPVELKSMVEIVEDLESVKINVKWIHKRLDEINEAFQLTKGYSALKDMLATNLIVMERKKKELKVMQDELDAMVDEREKITEALLGTRAKIKFFCRGSLVNGLL